MGPTAGGELTRTLVRHPRAGLGQALLAFAVAAGLGLTLGSGSQSLADADAYSHVGYARALWESGLRLRGHPFLPFTILGDTGVDLWLGFHWLLLPFAPFPVPLGARLAGAFVAGATAAGVALLLARSTQQRSWHWAVLPLLLSGTFALRGHVARPAHLTIPLVLASLLAGAGALSPLWALGAAFLHGLLHLSSPLSPLAALVGLAAARLTGRPAEAAGASGLLAPAPERALLWSIGGLGLALIVRPDRDLYAVLAALHNLTALGLLTGGARLPHTGLELQSAPLGQLLPDLAPGLLLVLLALVLGRARPRAGGRAATAAVLGALGPLLLFALRSSRFVDYLVPLLLVATALLWPQEVPWPERLRSQRTRAAGGALALVACALLLERRTAQVAALAPRFIDGPATFSALAREVRAQVPPGELLFTDDPFLTEVLWAELPDYRFVLAYDPAVLFLASPALFFRWHHLVVEGVACDAPACGPLRPDPDRAVAALRSFGATYAITSYPRGRSGLQELMGHRPDRFDLLFFAPGSASGLYLWRVRPRRTG